MDACWHAGTDYRDRSVLWPRTSQLKDFTLLHRLMGPAITGRILGILSDYWFCEVHICPRKLDQTQSIVNQVTICFKTYFVFFVMHECGVHSW